MILNTYGYPLGSRSFNTYRLPSNLNHPNELVNPVEIRQWYLDRNIDVVVHGNYCYRLKEVVEADYGSVCLPGPGYMPYWPFYVTQVVTDLRNYAPKVYASYRDFLGSSSGSILRLTNYDTATDHYEVGAQTKNGAYSACYPMPKPEMWREAIWSYIGRPF